MTKACLLGLNRLTSELEEEENDDDDDDDERAAAAAAAWLATWERERE